MVAEPDYIIVGSGINSLVCAGLLAKKGRRVAILERETVAGGCIKSGEVTLPGFNHDLMSGYYPDFLASPAYAALGAELGEHGLEFLNTEYPSGVILPDGRYFILTTDRAKNIDALNAISAGDGDLFGEDMDEFGANAHISFGLLGNELISYSVAKLLFGELRKKGLIGLTGFFGKAAQSARGWLAQYESEEARACFAPWVLHAGMDIDGAMSGYMGRVFAFALETVGMPVVTGGSENLVKAFQSMLKRYDCDVLTNVDVESIELKNGLAVGVRCREGRRFAARKGVICNVPPPYLYGEKGLLPRAAAPDEIQKQSAAYKFGRGNMIVHLALSQKPNWPHADLTKAAMLHIGDGLAQTTQSLTDAKNGYLPKRATIAVGQKAAVDPSRVPEGRFSLWLQLHEIPRKLKGDAAGVIDGSSGWTDAVKNQYADRIISQLSEYAPGLEEIILGRNVYAPPDLERLNKNLVGGDPYSGANTLDQFLLWRPLRGTRGHRTPVKNVFHIGASTHPGPGLGGGSGYLVGKQLK